MVPSTKTVVANNLGRCPGVALGCYVVPLLGTNALLPWCPFRAQTHCYRIP